MRKLDKLILRSFLGPFVLTFLVVVFILLMVQMLKYFDDIIGKDLGAAVISKLLFYFAVFTTPTALPLAVLLSALITYGNLGEHFELTAIKSAGISLLRTLLPIFWVVLLLTASAFYINNNLVPKAALEAYSLLYDIKQKKPSLELREGTFYYGIPDISIKVDEKFPEDEAALKGIVVYDHRKGDGNRDVIKADSGRMYTILNQRYLKFELYRGFNYREGVGEDQTMTGTRKRAAESFTRSSFEKTQMVYDLSSFDLQVTDKKWFQGNRIMRNLKELDSDIDSLRRDVLQHRYNVYQTKPSYFRFSGRNDSLALPEEIYTYKLWKDSVDKAKYAGTGSSASDSVARARAIAAGTLKPDRRPVDHIKGFSNRKKAVRRSKTKAASRRETLMESITDSATAARTLARVDSVYALPATRDLVQAAANFARTAKTQIEMTNVNIDTSEREERVFLIQWHRILSSSLACVAMFLIGAPLGSIIKKGGLGVPFLVSITFFIIYYLLTMQGEKLAKQGAISVFFGVWIADIILFVIGFIFLRQSQKDARLFDADSYKIAFDKVKKWVFTKRQVAGSPSS
jgi:lipopolysaccharide export system permease protein